MEILSEIGPSLPTYARRVLEQYLSIGTFPKDPGEGKPPAPVFVTLHDRDNALRGCIGTLVAQRANIFDETAKNAVSAATRDPRFPRVQRDELDHLTIDVTVLHPLEEIRSEAELEPLRYGVVVRDAEGRQGVLLPDLPGIDDVKTQVRIARQKARILETTPITLYRFLAERFVEGVRKNS
jgi:AmmeMemoRadiSam system protein A